MSFPQIIRENSIGNRMKLHYIQNKNVKLHDVIIIKSMSSQKITLHQTEMHSLDQMTHFWAGLIVLCLYSLLGWTFEEAFWLDWKRRSFLSFSLRPVVVGGRWLLAKTDRLHSNCRRRQRKGKVDADVYTTNQGCHSALPRTWRIEDTKDVSYYTHFVHFALTGRDSQVAWQRACVVMARFCSRVV